MISFIKTLTNIISIITVAQLLLFGLFLITSKKGRGSDKIALAFFLFANSIYIMNFLAFRYRDITFSFSLNLFFIGNTFGFLFGPLLYLYTRYISSNNFGFKRKDLFHFIPFLIMFCLTLVLFQFQSYETKLELLKTGLYSDKVSDFYFIIMNISILVYLSLAILTIRRKNHSLKGYYSSLEKINYNWLKLVISAFFIMWIVDLIHWILVSLEISTPISRALLTLISLSINFIFANLLILKSLHLPQTEEVNETHKYEKSPLTIQTKNDILLRLEILMLQEKLFLNPSVTLGEIAQKLSVVPRYLSQVINELKGQNFYDFVNGYRIDEAKKILSDPVHNDEKILAVLFDCGFNSKSVFNTVFKKSAGITPSEYRRKYKRSA
jgi:AraC-like DNA-binding protein